MRGRNTRSGGILLALATVLLLAGNGPASAGFFDFLFGGQRPSQPQSSPAERPAPRVTPRTQSRSERSSGREPRISGGGSPGATSYCVRLCDGRYFPVHRTTPAQATQVCSALCPAAETRVFFGSDIDHASSSDGKQYDDLENAFVYRQKTVDNCTCNGHSPYGLATLSPSRDPTLRAGDLVATEDGLKKATAAKAYGKGADEDITSALRPSVSDDDGKRRSRRHHRSGQRSYRSHHDAWQQSDIPER